MNPTPTLLDAADEVRLARSIEAGLLAAHLLANGDTRCAGESDLRAVAQAGEAAWEQFLLANVRLVHSVVAPVARRCGVGSDELFQEGFLGLADAVVRWDFAAGYRFSTYAMAWIKRRVTDASVALDPYSPTSARTALRARRVRGIADELTGELHRDPSDDEVAHLIGRSSAWVGRMRALRADAALEPDLVAAPEQPEPEFGATVPVLLPSLPWLERQVVIRRFGFDGAEPLNQRAAADALGLSLSTLRRHEARALRRLRGWLLADLAA